MAKREFVMLAQPYAGQPVGGWYWSEKLDGCRAYWDGGITRGRPASGVPFANTAKDARYVTPPVATGLWSRYGKPIQAPAWWLDLMPPYPLDGELYAGRGCFQQLVSTIKTISPGPAWEEVCYMAFDSPPYHAIFANGEMDNPNFRKTFEGVLPRLGELPAQRPPRPDFRSVNNWLAERPERGRVFRVHEQSALPYSSAFAAKAIGEILEELLAAGAEGMMLRSPTSVWAPQRARTLLKVKGMMDAEAEVVGYMWGRETERGSKLLGLMGALVVEYRGRRFELSGFTDQEREMCYAGRAESARGVGIANPGKAVAGEVHNPTFPIGSRVTFKFREHTDGGIPKEARYWRRHPGD